MNELFDAVSARLKAAFTAHVAHELEADLIDRHVERKAALLNKASELDEQGLGDLAAELRRHAGEMALRGCAQTPPAINGAGTLTTQAARVPADAQPSGNGRALKKSR